MTTMTTWTKPRCNHLYGIWCRISIYDAVLQGPQIVSTPRIIVNYARIGYMSNEEARTPITTISPHRRWENSPSVT